MYMHTYMDKDTHVNSKAHTTLSRAKETCTRTHNIYVKYM
jgi:hypothetical protein